MWDNLIHLRICSGDIIIIILIILDCCGFVNKFPLLMLGYEVLELLRKASYD